MTAAALELSIKHHENNLKAETPDNASTSSRKCALCKEYFSHSCKGCPVYRSTNETSCIWTPYLNCVGTLETWKYSETEEARTAFREAERAEIKFLKSLRSQYS